jgi:hypothetical protein
MNLIYLVYGSIGLGVLILLSNMVDFSYLISKTFFGTNKTSKKISNKEEEFLHIVGLWYQLKEKCDAFELKTASDKLDEVFPLLNGVLEDEVVS